MTGGIFIGFPCLLGTSKIVNCRVVAGFRHFRECFGGKKARGRRKLSYKERRKKEKKSVLRR